MEVAPRYAAHTVDTVDIVYTADMVYAGDNVDAVYTIYTKFQLILHWLSSSIYAYIYC